MRYTNQQRILIQLEPKQTIRVKKKRKITGNDRRPITVSI